VTSLPGRAADETAPSDRSVHLDHRRRDLGAYATFLRTHAVPRGAISRRDADRVLERHVLDSTRAVACIPASARSAVDIGSGAGLPGIPVAICRPDLAVFLVEPRRSRVAVLEAAVAAVNLRNVTVIARRAQKASIHADVALARALGDPMMSWTLARPLLSADGILIYFAGRSWAPEAWDERMGAAGVVATICAPSTDVSEGPLIMMRGAAASGPSTGADRRDPSPA
jgi:16S rRNA (guanine527-N7)-methyltransferase